MIYLLTLLLSFNCFAEDIQKQAEVTQQQVEDNLKQCGFVSSKEFIMEKFTACTDINAWEYCPDTGIRHFNGMCDSMSQDEFLEVYEEVE